MEKTGPAFGEGIITEKIKRRSYKDSKTGIRFYLIPIFLILAVLLILAKLFFLQIIYGNYYRTLSDTNRIKTIVVHSPRGIIFDRREAALTFNVPGFRQKKGGETKLISQDEAISMLAEGKDLEIDSLREYPYKEAAAHVIGYLGQISEEELRSTEFSQYRAGDVIGKMGIERQYEKFLKGEDGKQLVEIDSKGKFVRKLGETDPIPGRNITLTIDSKLQKKSYEAMKSVKKGALIVSTPRGEILALVSKPSFDPNLFTQPTSNEDGANAAAASFVYKSVSEVLSDSSNQPFLNRAISGAYPPGSTFKLITAAAGLQNGIIDLSYSVEDTGVIRIGEFSFANWYFTSYGGKDGNVNVVKGIKRSNDIFFYKLAEKVGVERLSEMAREFGIGKT